MNNTSNPDGGTPEPPRAPRAMDTSLSATMIRTQLQETLNQSGRTPFGNRLAGMILLMLATGNQIQAQTPVVQPQNPGTPSYWSNEGKNAAPDSDLGEFSDDLGGHAPFSSMVSGHPWWYEAAGTDLQTDAYRYFHRIEAFEAAIQAGYPTSASMLLERIVDKSSGTPVPGSDAIPEPENPMYFDPWWISNGNEDYVTYENWRINGGYIQILRRTNPPSGLTEVHAVFLTLQSHKDDLISMEYLVPGGDETPFASNDLYKRGPRWSGLSGSTNFWPEEYALEQGHLMVIVIENLAQSPWIQLQRHQEAEYFVREYYMPEVLGLESGEIGRSFLYGGSWGAFMSNFMAILQPDTWAGSLATLGMDPGFYLMGDWFDLRLHKDLGLGIGSPASAWPVSNDIKLSMYPLVDMLDIRFDQPASGEAGWEFNVMSQLLRETDLKIPVRGFVGCEDFSMNYHWEKDSSTSTNYGIRYFKHLGHGDNIYMLQPGLNEYYYTDNSELDAVINASSEWDGSQTSPLIPSGAAPDPAYPDPYSHTLRHCHCESPVPDVDFLEPFDLQPDVSGVDTVGQGVWIGNFDTMFVEDIDDDGALEVLFGNFDGFVHVLEIEDPFGTAPRLIDEYRSPSLGYGLFAMDRKTPTSNAFYFGTAMGEVYKFRVTGADSYTISLFASRDEPSIKTLLAESQVGLVYSGNFDTSALGKEVLVLNRYLDWVLFDKDGMTLSSLNRGLQSMGPGQCAVASNVDVGVDQDVLLVPSLDGHVWYLYVNEEGDLLREELVGYTDRALYRIVPVDDDPSASGPEKLLLFGRKGDLPEGSGSEANQVMLFELNSSLPNKGTMLFAAAMDPALIMQGVSFAWIDQPSSTEPYCFAGAGGSVVQLFRVDPAANENQFTVQASLEIFTVPEQEVSSAIPRITALEFLPDGGGSIDGRLLAATSNGRLFFLDVDCEGTPALSFSVTSEVEIGQSVPQGETPLGWYSNRTFGHEFAADMFENTDDGHRYLFLGEYGVPVSKDTSGEPWDESYRVGALDLGLLDGTAPVFTNIEEIWTPWEGTAPNATRGNKVATLNRNLFVFELDGNFASQEIYAAAETGTVLLGDGEPGSERLFSLSATAADFTGIKQAPNFGGYVFEILDPGAVDSQDFSVLSPDSASVADFTVPNTDTSLFDGGSATDWWWPKVGDNRMHGQIANNFQGANLLFAGTSMVRAELFDPDTRCDPQPVLKEHVVVGTLGGYVYGIQPGPRQTPGIAQNDMTYGSRLCYASKDLGMYPIGLDSGDLDESTVEDEIVVGTFLDTGSRQDWEAEDPFRNRGALTILAVADCECDPGCDGLDGGSTLLLEEKATLYGDIPAIGLVGLGSGVFGVKLDDVDADGDLEIWSSDAAGHLYLFHRMSADPYDYKMWGRSGHLGTYPGAYGNIFPVKNDLGETIRVYVVSPGYVMAYKVQPQRLTPDPWSPPQ